MSGGRNDACALGANAALATHDAAANTLRGLFMAVIQCMLADLSGGAPGRADPSNLLVVDRPQTKWSSSRAHGTFANIVTTFFGLCAACI
jgi:hypothetical protein